MSLTIGKRYELSGWVRSEGLTVRDLDRSPIATGYALSMASMPQPAWHADTVRHGDGTIASRRDFG